VEDRNLPLGEGMLFLLMGDECRGSKWREFLKPVIGANQMLFDEGR
jgi:hypothetical protein